MPDLTKVTVGQPTELEVTVTVDGNPIDPSGGQSFKVGKPDGDIVDLGTGTNQGGNSGVVAVVYDAPDIEGDYWWTFEATQPKTKEQHVFVAVQDRVQQSGLGDYALTTVNHARLFVKRTVTAGSFDAELAEILINSYSQAVMRYCERQFKPQEENTTKLFTSDGYSWLDLAPYDLSSASEITINALGVTAATLDPDAHYVLHPRGKTGEGTYTGIELPTFPAVAGGYQVSITGDWGCAVPADVELATLIAVADGYRNPEGGATRRVGELEYTELSEGAEVRGRALPADSRSLLEPFMRVGI